MTQNPGALRRGNAEPCCRGEGDPPPMRLEDEVRPALWSRLARLTTNPFGIQRDLRESRNRK
jgi:hypothetical protein